MSISYDAITYIQDGQAINAANLNAPSVDLEARTLEVKRDSDYNKFKQDHTTDTEVVLVSDTPDTASIGVKTYLKNDGNSPANLIRYYAPEFNNLNFSVYAKSVPGSRYIIPGHMVGSVFSDSISPNSVVYSTTLSVPGDGVYAKIPLRHTGQAESLSNYPDLAYPRSKSQSVGSQYLLEALNAELVKLPNLAVMDILSSEVTENVATFVSRLETVFSAHIDLVQIEASGTLKITDSNGDYLTVQVRGTPEGANCEIVKLLERTDSQAGLVLEFSKDTAPIYIQHTDARLSTNTLSLALFDGAGVELDVSNIPFTTGNYLGYHILPEILDSNFEYVPLVRLTENSLLVADKSIDLTKKSLVNGETINVHGHPLLEADSEFQAEDIQEYKLNVLTNNIVDKAYKGIHTVVAGITAPVVVGEYTYVAIENMVTPLLKTIHQNVQVDDKIKLLSVTITMLEGCVSTTGNTDTLNCTVRLSMPSGVAYLSSGPTVTVPANSFDTGNVIELLPDVDNTYSYTLADANTVLGDIDFNFFIVETTGSENMVSGKAYVEFKLAVF